MKRVYRLKDMSWINWYINRGILPLNPTKSQLRRLSWRRKF